MAITIRIVMAPSNMPSSGETKMKMPALMNRPASSEPKPALAMAAPAMPPSNACDDEVGSASHQVMRSQTMAPNRPAPTRLSETTSACTPLAMLLATCDSKKKNAMELKKAAQSTAWRGESTRVDTTVAMELAASWKPLM